MFPKYQSGLLLRGRNSYARLDRKGDSTETLLLRLISNQLWGQRWGQLSLLVPFDVSAACDTVDHEILMKRPLGLLWTRWPSSIDWITSFLGSRSNCVNTRARGPRGPGSTWSSARLCLGYAYSTISYIGALLFAPWCVLSHLYADDSQAYMPCSPLATMRAARTMQLCTFY